MDPRTFSESGFSGPAAHAASVSPADADLPSGKYTRSIYIGVTGNLEVMMAGEEGDTIVTFLNVPVGMYPLRVSQIRAATTAGGIVAVW